MEEKRALQVRLEASLYGRLEVRSGEVGETMSGVVRGLICDFLDGKKKVSDVNVVSVRNGGTSVGGGDNAEFFARKNAEIREVAVKVEGGTVKECLTVVEKEVVSEPVKEEVVPMGVIGGFGVKPINESGSSLKGKVWR